MCLASSLGRNVFICILQEANGMPSNLSISFGGMAYDAAGWVASLLGVLPREVIGFNMSISVSCLTSCSVNW